MLLVIFLSMYPVVYISEFEGECSLMHWVNEIVLVYEFIHDL